MQYIDKKNPKNRKKGNKITQELIKKQWINGSYQNLYYNGLDMSDMEDLLVQEQHGYCCYCMRLIRRVSNGEGERNVTIEHVIPNLISLEAYKKDKRKYANYFKFDKKHIQIHVKGKIENKDTWLKVPPYPHFIAYDNLVASCNGKLFNKNQSEILPYQCCNNCRGSDFILPLFFEKNIVNLVRYDSRGNLDCSEDYAVFLGKGVLNLMNHSLNSIRRFWKIISQSTYKILDIKSAKNDEILRENIIDDIEIDISLKTSLLIPDIWRLFADYSWFYQYYKNHPRL